MQSEIQRRRVYQPGDIVIRDGDCGNRFFLIETGAVEVFKQTAGKKVVIGKIVAGGIFGEMAVIDGKARMASVAALEPTVCRIFPPALLQKKIEDSDYLVQTIIGLFMQHIRKLTEAQIQFVVTKRSEP